MRTFADNSVDAIVTDPPYGLSFMGKKWDYDVPIVDVWREALRVLKPGGHLLAFGGARTYHRLAVAIEDAGFEIRDQVQWIYGQGFPKSLDISKAIDKAAGVTGPVVGGNPAYRERQLEHDARRNTAMRPEFKHGPGSDAGKQWSGWGTALKPANEPICLARKPISEKTVAANVLKWGTGGLNIDATRIVVSEGDQKSEGGRKKESIREQRYTCFGVYKKHLPQKDHLGRFPANIILDEAAGEMLDEQTGFLAPSGNKNAAKGGAIFGAKSDGGNHVVPGVNSYAHEGGGGPSRFFYCAKASTRERNSGCDKNNHPTVKPIRLMEYLVKLITPPGGMVLDPFMGSGTTGIASKNLDFDFIGIELNEEYFKIAQNRINSQK